MITQTNFDALISAAHENNQSESELDAAIRQLILWLASNVPANLLMHLPQHCFVCQHFLAKSQDDLTLKQGTGRDESVYIFELYTKRPNSLEAIRSFVNLIDRGWIDQITVWLQDRTKVNRATLQKLSTHTQAAA